jgi:hypothetical protein
MSRLRRRLGEEADDHDVSKELFLGVMMLMLCLGVMILNAAQPVWRVQQHDPRAGDVVVVYREDGTGLSRDGRGLVRRLGEEEFRRLVEELVRRPEIDLHLFYRGGGRELLDRHMAYADSLLSSDPAGRKVRPAVFVHGL